MNVQLAYLYSIQGHFYSSIGNHRLAIQGYRKSIEIVIHIYGHSSWDCTYEQNKLFDVYADLLVSHNVGDNNNLILREEESLPEWLEWNEISKNEIVKLMKRTIILFKRHVVPHETDFVKMCDKLEHQKRIFETIFRYKACD